MTTAATVPAQRSRPFGVVLVSLFLAFDAVVTLGQALFDTDLSTRAETLVEIYEWFPVFMALLAILKLVAVVGLWRGRRGAWVFTMIVVGITLLVNLYVYWLGDPAYLRMLANVVMALYLNQGAVRDYFEDPPSQETVR